ncbi:POTRA domain-containing protein [Ferruginibacter sp. HRS2-29]|uniref:POTRA domain-containing protein n=1 Tax=Ferruginibacter sp. HRS2-29 TaxID=2487334 RepID=UPI0020CF3C72|nr:POTRA domain-containing protein [Ferruginibacter sp. HRS2-29]MCP9750473.1 hypothetical protein [Ferruginibacter sp. HRS2-29]
MKPGLQILMICCLLANGFVARAQIKDSTTLAFLQKDTSAFVQVTSINISGNKKTKGYIILREMQFKEGDSIPTFALAQNLQQAHDQVYNTTLFSDVAITPTFISPTQITIAVVVKEKWYIYPTPQFQLVDRNVNEWIKLHNADLNRVIYGVKFAHYNFSGRRDQLRVYLLNGYARNISFAYSAPYSNSALTEGFSVAAGFTQNREVPYRTTRFNKLQQFNNGDFVRNVFSVSAGYTVRKSFFKKHSYVLSYTLQNVNDSLLSPRYNPNYYGSPKSHKGYLDMIYSFQYANTNNINYPLRGLVYGASVLKRGLEWKGGINMLMLDGYVARYLPHGNNWYSSFQGYVKIKAPFEQAYINQRALGYGDLNLRGLEYYVIDGVAATLGKYTLKKKVWSFGVPVPFKNRLASRIPFTIFAKTYADAGYVYSKPEFESMLNNRFLYSGGFGIDILTLYDINLKIEYSLNQLGEKGVFLQMRGGF